MASPPSGISYSSHMGSTKRLKRHVRRFRIGASLPRPLLRRRGLRRPRVRSERSIHRRVSFSCTPFWARRARRLSKSTRSRSWSWLKQENTTLSTPVAGSRWTCRHWAQISFIMHCIGELIEAMALCPGLRCGARMPWRAWADRRHHAVGADRDHAVDLAERDRRLAERARSIGVERRDDVADEGLVLRPVGAKARRLVAAPHDDVGRALDLVDLVAVDPRACSRRNRSRGCRWPAQRLSDREQHRVAEPAADQQHGFARASRWRGRSAP